VNLEETGRLVGHMALYDNRKTGDPDTLAWYQVIGDLPYDDAKAAVIGHYAESTDRIMPAHVRNRVKAMRRDRLEHGIVPAPDPGLTDAPGRYRAELHDGIRRIADSHSVQLAIGGAVREGDPPEAWTEARAKLADSLPASAGPLTPQELALQQARCEHEAAP
jgi:hypothetical protein